MLGQAPQTDRPPGPEWPERALQVPAREQPRQGLGWLVPERLPDRQTDPLPGLESPEQVYWVLVRVLVPERATHRGLA